MLKLWQYNGKMLKIYKWGGNEKCIVILLRKRLKNIVKIIV